MSFSIHRTNFDRFLAPVTHGVGFPAAGPRDREGGSSLSRARGLFSALYSKQRESSASLSPGLAAEPLALPSPLRRRFSTFCRISWLARSRWRDTLDSHPPKR